MQPNSNVRSLDDSLYEGQKALCEIEEIVGAINCHLTGNTESEAAGGYGLGGALAVADQNTGRLVSLAQRLREIRDLISAPKVESFSDAQAFHDGLPTRGRNFRETMEINNPANHRRD